LRGGLLPAYSLAALLGNGGSTTQASWIVVCGGAESLALAFDAFDGYWAVDPSSICDDGASGNSARRRQIVRVGGVVRNVVRIPSLVELIKERAGNAG